MDQPGVWVLQGTVPERTAIFLRGGVWNLMGYSSPEPRSVADCMHSVADSINSVWEYNPATGWSMYAPDGVSNLELMKPGRGYWIKADRDCLWDINANDLH
jgi:hypothetical protein